MYSRRSLSLLIACIAALAFSGCAATKPLPMTSFKLPKTNKVSLIPCYSFFWSLSSATKPLTDFPKEVQRENKYFISHITNEFNAGGYKVSYAECKGNPLYTTDEKSTHIAMRFVAIKKVNLKYDVLVYTSIVPPYTKAALSISSMHSVLYGNVFTGYGHYLSNPVEKLNYKAMAQYIIKMIKEGQRNSASDIPNVPAPTTISHARQ